MAGEKLEWRIRLVPPSTPEEHLFPVLPKPIRRSFQESTKSSSTHLSDDSEELPSSPFIITNLNTGQSLDLREECKPGFSTQYAEITSAKLHQALKLW